jgi:hypothetical protein
MRVPGASIDRLIEASYDGQPLSCQDGQGAGIECAVPRIETGGALVLRWKA